jgi:hypothetical protein
MHEMNNLNLLVLYWFYGRYFVLRFVLLHPKKETVIFRNLCGVVYCNNGKQVVTNIDDKVEKLCLDTTVGT